jgi:hypothetical protein
MFCLNLEYFQQRLEQVPTSQESLLLSRILLLYYYSLLA